VTLPELDAKDTFFLSTDDFFDFDENASDGFDKCLVESSLQSCSALCFRGISSVEISLSDSPLNSNVELEGLVLSTESSFILDFALALNFCNLMPYQLNSLNKHFVV